MAQETTKQAKGILPTASKALRRIRNKARKNRQRGYLDSAVEVRWDISSRGNIRFCGWLRQLDTWYLDKPQCCFSVIDSADDDGNYRLEAWGFTNDFEISQDLLQQLRDIEIDI